MQAYQLGPTVNCTLFTPTSSHKKKKHSYSLRNYNLCFTRTTYTNVSSIFIKMKWYLFVIRSHKTTAPIKQKL